jgi:pyrimidine-nucleoside phosphorylase
MNNPLGSNIGNKLEVKEVINFFNGVYDKRLYDLIINLSSYMVSISKNISYSKSSKLVIESLNNNSAKNKFYEWISSQGGDIKELRINSKRIDVKSDKSGYISSIDASDIGMISTLLIGKKKDLNTGIVLRKKIGDFVEKDEVVASIYYNKEVNNMISTIRDSFKYSNNPIKEKSIILKTIK